MSYTEQQLSKLTESALAKLAKEEFGLDTGNDSKASMVKAVLAAQAEAEQDVAVPAADPGPPEPPAPPKRFKIIVHNQEGVENTAFVKVGVNGTMYQIKREVEVEVPEPVVNVLKEAVIDKYEPGPDGSGTALVKVRRFPFTVLGEAA